MTATDTATPSRIHFMGIGGVSMHGLALWYHHEGYTVSGCDAQDGPVLSYLRTQGIEVHVGHDAAHVHDGDVVVHTMAVRPEHPELVAARARGARVVRRIELLGELFTARNTIAVTGTHGKSTTTGMIATLLLALEPDPSIHIGARLAAIDGNVRFGAGPWMVAEVDESDPGFADLRSAVGVLTNLEDDHIAGLYEERRNYHASLADLEDAARSFARGAERVLYCADWPRLEELVRGHARASSYGESEGADYRLRDLMLAADGSSFRLERPTGSSLAVRLAVPGRHNALNAAAALAALDLAGIDPAGAVEELARYHGVGRRWERWGEPSGALVVDDYAHHPTEVAATLRAARATGRRVRAVLQPHRWVRTARHWRALADAASLADEVVVLDIYSAGEDPIPGVSADAIADRIRERGLPASRHDLSSAYTYLRDSLRAGDLVLTLGAGDVWAVAKALVTPGAVPTTAAKPRAVPAPGQASAAAAAQPRGTEAAAGSAAPERAYTEPNVPDGRP